MSQVINWLLLLIIFVFDPLAISLVVATNFAFDQIRPKEKKLYKPEENWIDENQEVKMSVPEGKEFNKPYPIPETPKPNREEIEKLEKKIDQIKGSGMRGKAFRDHSKPIQDRYSKYLTECKSKKDDEENQITY